MTSFINTATIYTVKFILEMATYVETVLFRPAYEIPECLSYQPMISAHTAKQYYVTPVNMRPHMSITNVKILSVQVTDDLNTPEDVTALFKTMAGPYMNFYGQRVVPAQIRSGITSMKVMYTIPENPWSFRTVEFSGKELHEPMTFQYGMNLGAFCPEMYKNFTYIL